MSAFSYARLSPPGRGAIGLVAIRGEAARALLPRVFQPSRGFPPGGREVRHGRFLDGGGVTIDDGLLIPLPGDEPPAWLLSLHGNPVLIERLLEHLGESGGIEEEDAPSFLFPVSHSRLWREAIDLLPRARTPGACAFLLEQGGETGSGLAAWAAGLRGSGRGPGEEELEGIISRARRGRALFEARRVVLAGVPNAGKSTLFNRLLGRRRVVTDPEPGTTRDLIEEEALIGETPILLVDGAGLRESSGEIEKEGVRRMRRAMEGADLVVLLCPPRHLGLPSPEMAKEAARLAAAGGSMLRIRSRADQIPAPGGVAGKRETSQGATDLLEVSAVTGEGIARLRAMILERLLGEADLPRGVAVPFLERHEGILRAALADLRGGVDPRPRLLELL